ncbi:MAG TPA: circadian clock protein KaiC [Syntrophobacteraceae bacterium]|nr:circadian clock protein KaiC [Syntrophobacteraceae bacterium]
MPHRNRSKETFSASPLAKAPTHIKGLDTVLEGGLPRGRTTVVNGGPGSGKTLLALEFLYRGALAGEPGVFIGFEEPLDQLRVNAGTLGWDLAALERDRRLCLVEGRLKPDTLVSGEFSLKGLLAGASGVGREIGAGRVVIDALEVVLRLYDSLRQVRNDMHLLNDWLQAEGLSAILTVRPPVFGSVPSFHDFFDSMADCVIYLDARVDNQLSRRRIRVVKYRGSGFGSNEYPYVITDSGLHIEPISTVGLRHKPLGERVSTGLARLDDFLGGGYRRGACILVAGSPGTGKTLLAGTFSLAACGRGEKVLYVGYEESQEAVIGNMGHAGVFLKPCVDTGLLLFHTVMPEAMGPEEHLIRVMNLIEAHNPRHLVVDAISACGRMGGKQAAFDFLVRLLNRCKERNITVLLVNQLSGTTTHMEVSGNDISSIIDTVLFMSYVEGAGEINRVFQVLKSRGSGHSNQKQEYIITDEGIRILEPYTGEGEVLTGSARRLQEARDAAEAQRLAVAMKAKEIELEQLRIEQRQITERKRYQAQVRGAAPGSADGEDRS